MRIANCSTAANYFHLLRRQGLLDEIRPLVVFTPKSLLRAKAASSSLDDLTKGRFEPVLPEGALLLLDRIEIGREALEPEEPR
jgi:2-oxoglutarate dehydrogenase E1 component/2-oxoglutarate decarboxylase